MSNPCQSEPRDALTAVRAHSVDVIQGQHVHTRGRLIRVIAYISPSVKGLYETQC